MTDHFCRRYRTKQAALCYNQLGGRHGRFYSDTMFSAVKSIHGNTMRQIFVNDIGYTRFTPMKAKSEARHTLLEFIQDVGIPQAIYRNDAKELTQGKWHQVCRDHVIKQTQTEPYDPFQNRAEVNTRELKKHTCCPMQHTRTPLKLWDFCAQNVSEVRSITAQPLNLLHRCSPFEMITGNTPDIL